jgi:single-strand DNA-binding protein
MGNLTRDVELKYTQANTAVGSFGMAVNHRYKSASGEMKEEVMFIDCDAWGKTAEMMSKFFTKGRPVLIEGRLRLDTWQDKNDGSKRSKHKIVVENFHFVDSKPGSEGGGGGGRPSGGGGYADEGGGGGGSSYRPAARPSQNSGPSQPTADPGYEPIQEDDIPF